MRALVHLATFFILGLEVHLEEILLVLICNTNALIRHFEVNANVARLSNDFLLNAHEHIRVIFTEFDRVLDEID